MAVLIIFTRFDGKAACNSINSREQQHRSIKCGIASGAKWVFPLVFSLDLAAGHSNIMVLPIMICKTEQKDVDILEDDQSERTTKMRFKLR